jgi:superfamily II DNA helicase RecQ
MKMRFFLIPVQESAKAADELNGFLSNRRILGIDRHFVPDGTNSAWAVCVSYLESAERPAADKAGARIDYREVLNDADFQVFARLRSLRKTLAEQDGVPAYALFTNEQLADMVRQKVTTVNALERISGVGPARSKKYGAAFLELLKVHVNGPAEIVETDGRGPK